MSSELINGLLRDCVIGENNNVTVTIDVDVLREAAEALRAASEVIEKGGK